MSLLLSSQSGICSIRKIEQALLFRRVLRDQRALGEYACASSDLVGDKCTGREVERLLFFRRVLRDY